MSLERAPILSMSPYGVENPLKAETIGKKAVGVVLVLAGTTMIIWGANKAINGIIDGSMNDFIIGGIAAYAGWKIAGKGIELLKNRAHSK